MDLKIFFSPVEEESYEGIKDLNSIYRSIKVHTEKMPPYADADIAIIGIVDESGWEKGEGSKSAPAEIRKKFYNLRKGSGAYRIVDLGNLRSGMTFLDTRDRLQEVCEILVENNVLPLVLGGSQGLDYGIYKSYEHLEKLVSVLNIDAYLDMTDGEEMLPSQSHVQKILVHEPNYLFNYCHLAYQSYLVDKEAISTLEMLYFDVVRIGELRTNLSESEPIIRSADILSFDISAIRGGDAPGAPKSYAFGLTGEEACQMCWYAGQSDKLSSAGFFEYNPLFDDSDRKTAQVIAVMLWYFVEGYYHRKNEKDFKTNEYMKYVVSMPSEPASLIFYKSKLTDKWWMEVPHPNLTFAYTRNCIVPCSYGDYESANKGELPDRYINALAKLI
jgi:formiminoglutamase